MQVVTRFMLQSFPNTFYNTEFCIRSSIQGDLSLNSIQEHYNSLVEIIFNWYNCKGQLFQQ